MTAGCGLLRADTPAWLIVLFVLLSGCVRSIQYLGLNTISYADVPGAVLSKSTSVSGVAQQLAQRLWHRDRRCLLALIAGPRMLTAEDFRVVFFLIALLPLLLRPRVLATFAARRRRSQRATARRSPARREIDT